MRILIIGGTRFIGPFVVRKLWEMGHEVLLFHRNPPQSEFPAGVRHIYGERKRLKEYVPEFSCFAPEVVLDMIPSIENDAITVMDIFSGVAERVVAISSQDVYLAWGRLHGTEPGLPEPVPLREDAPVRSRLFPYRGKVDGMDDYDKIPVEKRFMGDGRLPGTILRLPMVYGPGDHRHRLFEYLKRMDDGRPAILLEEGFAKWRWTKGYVENVADAIILAVTDMRAVGKIFNVGEPETHTMKEWITEIGMLAGWEGKILEVPAGLMPSYLLSDINTEQHIVTDSTFIGRELNHEERIPPEESMRRTIEWERAHPPDDFAGLTFDYAAEDAVMEKLSMIRSPD